MKAKVIKTGEIVDVYHEPQHGQVSNIYKESVLVNGRMWSEEELDFFVKANKAPEKIFICDYGSELGFEWHSESDWEHQGSNDIEYTRTDALIEKACDTYCAVCDTKECQGCAECSWVIKFRKQLMKIL